MYTGPGTGMAHFIFTTILLGGDRDVPYGHDTLIDSFSRNLQEAENKLEEAQHSMGFA